MTGFEEDNGPQDPPAFLHDKDNFPHRMCPEDVTFVPVSYPSSGEKKLPPSCPQGNSCRDIPPKKNDSVDYPGRSVLYSRQFRPFTLENQHRIYIPRSGKP
jgi:hypothetical protein